jgi:hypothetical protein
MLYDAASGTKTTSGTTLETLVDIPWPGRYLLTLDLNALTVVSGTADIYEVSFKGNVLDGGTERQDDKWPTAFIGGQLVGQRWTSDPFLVTDSGETFVQRVQGSTDRAIPYRLTRFGGKPGIVQSDGGNSATQFKTDFTESTNDHFKRCLVRMLKGGLKDQLAEVNTYVGSTKIITLVAGFTGTPANGDPFEVIG